MPLQLIECWSFNHNKGNASYRSHLSYRSFNVSRFLTCLTVCFILVPVSLVGDEPTAEQLKFFETRIRPLLSDRCYECHSGDAGEVESEFQIDSREGILRGGIHGPAVVPGDPDKSLMIFAVNHAVQMDMPPKFKLPQREIDDLTNWVKMGLPWPDAKSTAQNTSPEPHEAPLITAEDRQFWSFRPPQSRDLPRVRNRSWISTQVDYFILARLEAAGMTPARPATRRTLIRRSTFDLTGLPPTPAEVRYFLADNSPGAYSRLIDRLLSSPAYGERWGRHWLDVARYADSNGLDENLAYANAFHYRDYVVTAFNRDKSFAQFVSEQLAGDLLPDDAPSPLSERITATGFLSLGAKMLAEDDPLKMQMDIIDEQIDTLGRAFMGLTLGCARCHDHKFDPIPTADYYSLAGIFKSTTTMDNFNVVARWHERPVASAKLTKEAERIESQLTATKEQISTLRAEAGGEALDNSRQQVGSYLLAAQQLDDIDTVLPASRTLGNDPTNLTTLESQTIEAEAFQRGDVATLTEGDGADIGIIASHEGKPGFVEYDIQVTSQGLYQLELRYAAASTSPCTLSIDGQVVRHNVAAGVTGSGAAKSQFWSNIAIVSLEPGPHVIRIQSGGLFPHLDKLRLIRLAGSLAAVGKDSATEDLAAAARGLLDAVTIEAETFQRGNVNRFSDGYGALIGAAVGQGGHNTLEYDLTVPRPGTYHLVFRYAAADSRPTRLAIGDKVISPAGLAGVTGTWYPDTQRWEYQGTFQTATTSFTLTLDREGPISHLDRLLLLPGLSVAGDSPAIDPYLLGRWRAELEKSREQEGSVLASWHRAVDGMLPLTINNQSSPAESLLLASGPVGSRAELAERYQQVFQEAKRQWQAIQQGEEDKNATGLADPTLESFRCLLYGPDGPLVDVDLPSLALDAVTGGRISELQQVSDKLTESLPDVPHAMAVTEGTIEDLRIHIRGNHITLGDKVPRQFPSVLSSGTREPVDESQSGRLQLARWLVSKDHPLTARVIANRTWQWHVGQALVRSPDNFGRLGQRPTHPELLDFLALYLQDAEWSLKSLHRMIMLSSTYQMDSSWNDRYGESDPENKLVWRMNRRRLEAEEIRDSLLAVAGNLDRTMGGSLLPIKNRAYVTSTANIDIAVYENRRRSLYLPVVRSALYTVFQVFDFAEPSVPSGKRQVTNIASQALFIMNSTLVMEQSKALAQQLLAIEAADDDNRIEQLYLQLLARPPDDQELESCRAHLERYNKALQESGITGPGQTFQSWQSLCRALLASNEFIYLD
jgi:hypothetical protein